jgi:bifunctional DNase/RNase
MKKIELEIVALSDSNTSANSYALILGEKGGGRKLPIIIGGFEAQAIAIELENMKPARPLTHDLFKNFASEFDIEIEEVVIADLREGIFYSRLHCRQGNEIRQVDARTSDALALAVRFGCPVYTFSHVLDSGGVILDADRVQEPSDSHAVINNSEDLMAKAPESKPSPYRKLGFAELQERLQQAVDGENYEEAALIRDELQKRGII